MAPKKQVAKELDVREFHVHLLVRRSESRAGWVAFALELGVLAQADSLIDVLSEVEGVCNTFIVDALTDGTDPTDKPWSADMFAAADRVRADGVPMILPRRAYPLLDEAHVVQLLLPVTFTALLHVAVPPAFDALLNTHIEMAL